MTRWGKGFVSTSAVAPIIDSKNTRTHKHTAETDIPLNKTCTPWINALNTYTPVLELRPHGLDEAWPDFYLFFSLLRLGLMLITPVWKYYSLVWKFGPVFRYILYSGTFFQMNFPQFVWISIWLFWILVWISVSLLSGWVWISVSLHWIFIRISIWQRFCILVSLLNFYLKSWSACLSHELKFWFGAQSHYSEFGIWLWVSVWIQDITYNLDTLNIGLVLWYHYSESWPGTWPPNSKSWSAKTAPLHLTKYMNIV